MGQAPTNALAADYTYRKKKEQQREKYMTLHSQSERTINRRCTPYIKQSQARSMSVDFAREESIHSDAKHELAPLQLRQFVGILSNDNPANKQQQEQQNEELADNASNEQYEEDVDGFHLSMDYDELPEMQIDIESLKQLLLKRLSIDDTEHDDNEHENDGDDEEYDCLTHADNEYTQTENYHKASQSIQSLDLLMNENEDGVFKSISEMMFGQHLMLENENVDEELINNENQNDIINKKEDDEELCLSLKSHSETTCGTETDIFSSINTSQSLSHDHKYKSIDTPESITYSARDSALNFIAHGDNIKN